MGRTKRTAVLQHAISSPCIGSMCPSIPAKANKQEVNRLQKCMRTNTGITGIMLLVPVIDAALDGVCLIWHRQTQYTRACLIGIT